MSTRKVMVVIILTGILGSGFAADVTESVTTSDARERTYFLHTPPGYDGETPFPLVISLHYGGFEQGEEMAALTRMSEKADEEGFIAAYPDALAPGWSNHDALFLDELVDTLKARYTIDERRIFMTGYSAGALMTHWMACKLSDEVAAFSPVAGTMLSYDWTDCYPSIPPSIVSINARNDPMVPYEGDGGYYLPVEEAMANWAERLECDIGPDSFYGETGALRQSWSRTDGECDVVLWTTEEGGHSWPFEDGAHKLSANDVMWEFFDDHPLPVAGISEDESEHLEYDKKIDAPGFISKTATIRFSLPRAELVTIEIFDALGRRILVPIQKEFGAGEHTVILDGTSLEKGIYFCRIKTPSYVKSQRLIK